MQLFTVECVRWKDVERQLGELEILRLPDEEDVSDVRPWLNREQKPARTGFITADSFGKPGGKKGEGDRWTRIQTKVENLLEKTAISPLEGIKSETCFLNDKLLTNPRNRLEVDEAIKLWSHKINNWRLSKFLEVYSKSTEEELLFSVSKRYFTRKESVTILINLLKFQFDDDAGLIVNFLQSVVNVIDRQPETYPGMNPKNNAVVMYSPPSAGKNFFFDAIFSLLLNFGQMGTCNKHNLFSYQDLANRRIGLWNEPNYSSDQTETIKQIFEGADFKARVKNQADTHIKRTPIIVLTNNIVPFMVEKAFTDRIVRFNWKTAPFLKDLKLKPYPLAIFDVLDYYKIYYE